MKVEIDIDMGKIDYDAINEQIREKLEDLNPTDIFNRYYKTDSDISAYIENYLEQGSNQYIVNKGWWSNSSEAKNKIEQIAKSIITVKVQEVCDGILATMSEKELQELVYKILPNVFVNTMYEKILSALYNHDMQLHADLNLMSRDIVDEAFRSRSGY